jgi:hypothetical protein
MRGLTFLLGFTIAVVRDGDDEQTTENACGCCSKT